MCFASPWQWWIQTPSWGGGGGEAGWGGGRVNAEVVGWCGGSENDRDGKHFQPFGPYFLVR